MKNYLLVHGAWHGAWAWEETKKQLEAKGQRVSVLDLPGHGADTTPVKEVTFRKYVDALNAKLSTMPGKVVLVGHSLAGAIISQTAEEHPDRVEALVFVAGFILSDGESVLDVMKADADGKLLPGLIFTEDQSAATVSAETLKTVVYNGGTAEQVAAAAPQLRPQSTEPFFAKTVVSAPKFGALKKYYIECSDDQVLSISKQRELAHRFGCTSLGTLQSGHVPLVTAPVSLAAALAKFAQVA